MKRSTFDALVGFLQGVFWAFLIIGAWFLFHLVNLFDTGLAFFLAFLYIFIMLIMLLVLETVRVVRGKSDEQTRLLEEIRDLLSKTPGN